MPDVQLEIGGTVYSGWEELTVSKSIEAIAGKFTLAVSSLDPFPILAGDECKLSLDGEVVITGWVDSVAADIDSSNRTVSVSGRDKAGDLVDCSALNDSQEFNDISFKSLMEKLVAPFGLKVTVIPSLEKFTKFALQQETVFSAIDRACKLRGVFPNSDNEGNIVFAEYGKTRSETGLALGQNVLSGSSSFDHTDRFRDYYVYGQQPGGENVYGDAAAKVDGKAKDSKIARYRPLIIVAEGAVNLGVAQQRAQWEAAVRAARAITLTVTVQGWKKAPDAGLWQVNEIVSCDLQQLGVGGDMLIKDLSYKISNGGGVTTEIGLTRPDAYIKQPDLEAEESGKLGGEDFFDDEG